MEKFDESKTYVLTATRTRANWKEQSGTEMIKRSQRFSRGEKLVGDIPVSQVQRLYEMGHAVPEDEWDPEAFRKQSAARRLAMQQAAAADAKAMVAAAGDRVTGQPVVGLEDAAPAPKAEAPASDPEKRTVDGIVVEDVDGLPDPDGDGGEQVGEAIPDYENMAYPELVQLAKKETGNGGGNAEELKQRLREHYDQ